MWKNHFVIGERVITFDGIKGTIDSMGVVGNKQMLRIIADDGKVLRRYAENTQQEPGE